MATDEQIEELIRSTRAVLAATNRATRAAAADAVETAAERATLAARIAALEHRADLADQRRGLTHRALDLAAPFVASASGQRAIGIALVVVAFAAALVYSPALLAALPILGGYVAPIAP